MNPLGHEIGNAEFLTTGQHGTEIYFSPFPPPSIRFNSAPVAPMIAPAAEYHPPAQGFYTITHDYSDHSYRLPPFEALHPYPSTEQPNTYTLPVFELQPVNETQLTETNSNEEAAIQEYLVDGEFNRGIQSAFI